MARYLLAVAALVSAAGAATAAESFDDAPRAGACRPAPSVPGATEGASEPGTVAAAVGTLRAALLLVQPADAPRDESAAPPLDAIEAAAEWFRSVSYGRLDYRVQALGRWLELPGRSSDYAEDGARYLADTVAAADPYVDFSEVDLVYLSPPSAAQSPTTSAS